MPVPVALRRRAPWSAPVLVAAAVAAGVTLPGSAAATDHPALPALTARQLLADVQAAPPPVLSGTVVSIARLGLPSLPDRGAVASLGWQSLLTGTHTARLWLDGGE